MLAHLPAIPDPETHLRPVAHAIATCAAQAQHPAKSLAAFRRHRGADGLSPELLDALLLMADEEFASLASAQQPREAPISTAAWIGVEAAAHQLRTSVETVKEWLRTPEGRRNLGWPWWDGYRWRIPEPALDPAMRAAYMASLPSIEPPAHIASLPSWCERD